MTLVLIANALLAAIAFTAIIAMTLPAIRSSRQPRSTPRPRVARVRRSPSGAYDRRTQRSA